MLTQARILVTCQLASFELRFLAGSFQIFMICFKIKRKTPSLLILNHWLEIPIDFKLLCNSTFTSRTQILDRSADRSFSP